MIENKLNTEPSIDHRQSLEDISEKIAGIIELVQKLELELKKPLTGEDQAIISGQLSHALRRITSLRDGIVRTGLDI